ncbi:hypothetical protein KIN20_029719 [Parelaphostrongylus tenuis]|uniref:EB domain-containing protein n=1 Tax=Parelaphostrongylus tenuis TaxID=148309 RepID=A0AAD5R2U9_PARTN|nr:hypothetical protein KIN20_029719 [Parelaphostrongylus tenuis]
MPMVLASGLALRKLKYGELCQTGKDICALGAECIDSVCKCGSGLALSTNGWCERFEFVPIQTVKCSHRMASQQHLDRIERVVLNLHYNNKSALIRTLKDQKSLHIQKWFVTVSWVQNVATMTFALMAASVDLVFADVLKNRLRKMGNVCVVQCHFLDPVELCTNREDCFGNSFCVSGKCQCDGEHYAEDGYCRHIASRSSPIKYMAGSGLHFSTRIFQSRTPASICDEAICRLPNCFCSRTGEMSK